MCRHIWKTINDVRVCQRCGLTVRLLDGAVLFDRKLPDVKKGGGKRNK